MGNERFFFLVFFFVFFFVVFFFGFLLGKAYTYLRLWP